MNTACLEMCVQTFISTVDADLPEFDEVVLGLDTMLSHEVVKFLKTHPRTSKSRFVPRNSYKPNAFSSLDEHELAMV